jgi:hypothetical protein
VQQKSVIVGSLFLVLMVLPYVFFLSAFIKQQYLKYKVEERIERSNLQTIKLPKGEINWIEYGHELKVADRFFDVVSFTEKEGTFLVEGWFDEEETELEKKLGETGNETAKTQKNLFNFFQLLSVVFIEKDYQNNLVKKGRCSFTAIVNIHIIQQWCANVPSPPPQHISGS